MGDFKVTRRAIAAAAVASAAGCAPDRHACETAFAVTTVAAGLKAPWSLVFLPDGDMLVTEKRGGIRRIHQDVLIETAVEGGPSNILAQGDSGLLDIALDPQFRTNRLVFLTFIEGTENANRMAVFRARYDNSALREGEVIFRISREKSGDGHSGGRIVFLADETMLVTTGEGYDFREEAQNLRSHLGKVLRLNRDGRAPADNPFVGRSDVLAEVYTYGHRNPLGLLRDPRNDAVWAHEMGPRGGDEINLLRPGANYGWPLTTYGTDYDGTIISPLQEAPGVTAPVVVFNPSISPSGFALYLADAFPEWHGDFLLGALSGQHLRRVRIRDGMAVLEEVLLHDQARRIRDVRVGPEGAVYLLTDSDDGEVLRVAPV